MYLYLFKFYENNIYKPVYSFFHLIYYNFFTLFNTAFGGAYLLDTGLLEHSSYLKRLNLKKFILNELTHKNKLFSMPLDRVVITDSLISNCCDIDLTSSIMFEIKSTHHVDNFFYDMRLFKLYNL